MDENEWLADRFEEHRPHLRAVAYRMLGSLTEADDAVQDAWLRLSRAGRGRGREPRRVADHDRRPRLPEHAAVAHHPARGAARRPPPRSRRQPRRGRSSPRRRRCWPTRSASPCSSCSTPCHRPSGSRSCCTTCSSCPSRRSRRWSAGPRRRRGSSPAGHGDGSGAPRSRRPTPISPVSARWSTPSSGRPAAATSTPSSRCSIPTSCCAPTSAPGGPPPPGWSAARRPSPGRR